KNSVFDGILGVSILVLLGAPTAQPTLPFRYVPNCVETVESFVQVCLSGAQAAKEPRRTSLLRIKTRESCTGWMRCFMRHFEAGFVEAVPGRADSVRRLAPEHRPIRARCQSLRRFWFGPLPGPTVPIDIPTAPLRGRPRVARRRAAVLAFPPPPRCEPRPLASSP